MKFSNFLNFKKVFYLEKALVTLKTTGDRTISIAISITKLIKITLVISEYTRFEPPAKVARPSFIKTVVKAMNIPVLTIGAVIAANMTERY